MNPGYLGGAIYCGDVMDRLEMSAVLTHEMRNLYYQCMLQNGLHQKNRVDLHRRLRIASAHSTVKVDASSQ